MVDAYVSARTQRDISVFEVGFEVYQEHLFLGNQLLVAARPDDKFTAAGGGKRGTGQPVGGFRRLAKDFGRKLPAGVVGETNPDADHLLAQLADMILAYRHAHGRLFVVEDVAEQVSLAQEAARQIVGLEQHQASVLEGLYRHRASLIPDEAQFGLGHLQLFPDHAGLDMAAGAAGAVARFQFPDAGLRDPGLAAEERVMQRQ